jgi:hypothetical protein
MTPALDREPALGNFEAQIKVLGQSFDIALVESDQRIGTAVARALRAVIHRVGFHVVALSLAWIRREGEERLPAVLFKGRHGWLKGEYSA